MQAVWDTSIARTTSFMCLYLGEQNKTAAELSECTNTKYVAMDMYATLFIMRQGRRSEATEAIFHIYVGQKRLFITGCIQGAII